MGAVVEYNLARNCDLVVEYWGASDTRAVVCDLQATVTPRTLRAYLDRYCDGWERANFEPHPSIVVRPAIADGVVKYEVRVTHEEIIP